MARLALATLTLLSALAFHAQPALCQSGCVQATCLRGSTSCGSSCYCAATGPSPTGVCVSR